MDQATATIIGAVLGVSGTLTAAIIAVKWKSRSEPQHHVHEHRLSYPMVVEPEPWIRGGTTLARIARGVCWIVVAPLFFFGTGAVFWAVPLVAGWPFLLGKPELPHQNLIGMVLLPTGVLALIVGHWISKRIEIPRDPDDD